MASRDPKAPGTLQPARYPAATVPAGQRTQASPPALTSLPLDSFDELAVSAAPRDRAGVKPIKNRIDHSPMCGIRRSVGYVNGRKQHLIWGISVLHCVSVMCAKRFLQNYIERYRFFLYQISHTSNGRLVGVCNPFQRTCISVQS